MSIELIKKYNTNNTSKRHSFKEFDENELNIIVNFLLNEDFEIKKGSWGFDFLNKPEMFNFFIYNNQLISNFCSNIKNNNFKNDNLIFFLLTFFNDPWDIFDKNSNEEKEDMKKIIKLCLDKIPLKLLSCMLPRIHSIDLEFEYFIINKYKNVSEFKSLPLKDKMDFANDIFLINDEILSFKIFNDTYINNVKAIFEDSDIDVVIKKELFPIFYFNCSIDNNSKKTKFEKEEQIKQFLLSLDKNIYSNYFKNEYYSDLQKERLIKNISLVFDLLDTDIKDIIVNNEIFKDADFKQKYILENNLKDEIDNSFNKNKRKI